MDAISIIEFAIPLLMAFIFTIITIVPKGKDKPSSTFSGIQITLMSCVLASISWFIFSLIWLYSTTTVAFYSIAYLWMAMGVIFALLALYVGLRMLGTIFETKQPRLTLGKSVDGDGEE